MEIGSPEHKAQFYQDLIKTYQENIWKDELYLAQLDGMRGHKLKQIAEIDLALEGKKYKSKNDGQKAKFVAERELVHLEQEIAEVERKIREVWPERIEFVKRYAEEHSVLISRE